MDSEGELEDEVKENFYDGFDNESRVVANVDNHDEFRNKDFVWRPPETKELANLSFNEVEQPKVLPRIHDAKNLTVECKQVDL